MPSKLLRVRTATVVALALLAIGAMAAAASGLASTTAASSRSSGGQVAHEIGDAAARTHGPKAAAATNSSGSDRSRDHVAGPGPDASGPARHGLCQAWSAGQGDDHGKRADAPAFQALAAAAGGADQVAAYCEAELDAAARGQRPAASHGNAPVRTSPPATGPPQDPGQGNGRGNGQGGPPTTT
jgi:hypothetical protein